MSIIDPRLLELSAQHIKAIQSAAANSYPDECCGLLIGAGEDDVVVANVSPSANLSENRGTRFVIDPQLQFDLLRQLRGTRNRVIGHYHSHPNGVSVPSRRDIAMASDPAEIWVIIALERGMPSVPRAFVIEPEEDKVREIPTMVPPKNRSE
jgi:[CysO sulfur-carrier protein]-S-L-cysteine hydrolase